MLTQDQIHALRDQVEALADPIQDFLLRDIARRVSQAGQLTSSAAYQVWRSQQLGMSRKEIEKALKKMLKVTNRQLKELMTQTAEVGYNFDLSNFSGKAVPFKSNQSLQQIVKAAVKLAQKDFSNITQTLGMVAQDGKAYPLQKVYQKTMDFAFEQVVTGATDYNTAIRQATKNLADMGVRVIDYQSGVHTSLEAATRRNVMGGLGLMQEEISQLNHDSFGADGWEISAHAASAPDHEPYQGRQYSDNQYRQLNESLHRRIGTLNCGHAAFPIVLGVNRPQYTDTQLMAMKTKNAEGISYQGQHYTMYEATQKQRQIERAIRKQKNRILVDESTEDLEKQTTDRVRLARLSEEYRRFSKAAGMPTQRERAQVAGFGRGQAVRASAAAKPVIEFDKEHLAQSEAELLPNRAKAKIPTDKLSGYALNKNHPTGRNKAIVFEKVLGYTVNNQQLLISRVRRGLEKYKATERAITEHGKPFEVQMMLQGANGKYAKVKTGWQIDAGTNELRLITIYVDD